MTVDESPHAAEGDIAAVADDPVIALGPRWQRPRFGRWAVRIITLVGVALLVLGATGWWLSTRVLDDDGFADVIAQTSQQQPVRDYVADQATLRLAKSSSFVSAARPVVSKAVADVLSQPPVTQAIRGLARGAHAQIFRINRARRVDIDASQASVTIRSTLQAVDPSLAEKLPSSVLDSATTISQSKVVDLAARSSVWVRWLYLPVGLLGAAVLLLIIVWARERTHAVRFIGLTMVVAGAFPVGFGLAEPLFAAVGATTDPGRGPAVAAFVRVLLGRLVGAGWAMMLVGVLLACAPGRDGADLRTRAQELRRRLRIAQALPMWRLAAFGALIVLAVLLLTRPVDLGRIVLSVVGIAALYVGIAGMLRTSGLLASERAIGRLRKRQLAGVAVGVAVLFAASTAVSATVVAATNPSPRADAAANGCNGYVELCSQRLNQIVWPATHNSMSSTAYNFFSAEHTLSVGDQLNAGAKVLLLDVYYGYEQDGIVRTNLAGGADRAKLTADLGPKGVAELDRLGALTGTVDTSGTKKELYFCHDYCELGAVKAVDVLKEIRDYLNRNLDDVLILDFEDYVEPADLRKALEQAGLFDRIYVPDLAKPLPTLLDMVAAPLNQKEVKQRLITTSERHGNQERWLPATYSLMQETPYTFTAINQFDCAPNRGTATNPLLLVNHWLRPNGPPDPVAAGDVNSQKVLTARLQQCMRVRQRLPNILAVDFSSIGDLYKTVNQFNAAVAQATGATNYWTSAIDLLAADPSTTPAEAAEIRGQHRLPILTDVQATALLGPEVGRLRAPVDVTLTLGATDPVPLAPPEPTEPSPTPSASPTR